MAEIIWNSSDAELATGGKSTNKWQASGVSIDSRNINSGDLFIAIVGENFDGHNFVNEALKKCAAAVVNFVPEDAPEDANLLVVEGTIEAMRDMAEFSRKRLKGKVIAVTGSVGKTSTKEMLTEAFSCHGKTLATIGNLNNHYGLPLTLCRIPSDTEYCILEMGMSASGEISPLSVIARPDIAIITNVEPVHMEFFDSVEQISDAKSEIFDGMPEESVAILNRDNTHFMRMGSSAKQALISNIKSFGKTDGADYQLVEYSQKNGHGHVVAQLNGKKQEFDLGITGEHQALNAMAVLAAVESAGCDSQKSIKNLEKFSAKSGRGKKHKISIDGKSITIIDDTYNASPASVRAAIKTLNATKAESGGRAIAVLGDMFELGKKSEQMHADLSNDLQENKINLVFTAGELTNSLYNALPSKIKGAQAKNSEAIAPTVSKALQDGDIVLIKGSRGMRMERVVDYLLNAN